MSRSPVLVAPTAAFVQTWWIALSPRRRRAPLRVWRALAAFGTPAIAGAAK